MNQNPSYRSYRIKVSFAKDKVICKPNEQAIPPNTIATITWYPDPKCDFLFLQFEWIRKNGFLSQDPIIHDQCVIAAVNNTGTSTIGDWHYLLKVQVGDRVYQTRDRSVAAVSDGKPKIHTL